MLKTTKLLFSAFAKREPLPVWLNNKVNILWLTQVVPVVLEEAVEVKDWVLLVMEEVSIGWRWYRGRISSRSVDVGRGIYCRRTLKYGSRCYLLSRGIWT